MSTKIDYINEIKSKVKDPASKLADPEDWDAVLREALREYSFHRPWYINERISGNNTSAIPATTLSKWRPDFSMIECIEYPIGNTPPIYLSHTEWFLHNDGTKTDGTNINIVFLTSTPKSTEYINVRYKAVRELSDETDGINFPETTEHFVNITTLAAVHACRRLAGAFAQSMDASINADVVSYNDQSRKYIMLANQYREQYNLAVFGTRDGEPATHGAYELKPLARESESDPSGRFLFHRTRNR
jgi:hypothetical protein